VDQQASTSSGPSILSRDSIPTAQSAGKLTDFRLYGEITGVYDSGLLPMPGSPQGRTNAVADYGVQSGFGVIGSRRWKRSRLSIEYRGKYSYYPKGTLFNGSDQFLNLTYTYAFRPHLTLDLKETAGTTTLANGEFAYVAAANPGPFGIPTNELFDNRTNYIESRVTLVWQDTQRLSFDFGGDGFLVRRDSPLLAGLNGYDVRAGIAYRLTRRQTIGATYQHTSFDFAGTYGSSQIETAAMLYSVALSRSVDFALEFGGSRLVTSGLTQVAIDPAIAAIIGQSTATVTYLRVFYSPLVEARLTQRFNRSSLMIGYSTGITPGNGIYLTSRQTAGTAGLTYSSRHRFTAALNASYNTLSTLGQILPPYSNLQTGGGLTYRLVGQTHLEVRYDFRHYTTQTLLYQKDSNRITLGVAFSPGDLPLAIW